ncbi:hypothetical protein J6590_060929 [Homalodisca vitripennis]|nr:hypothetical protein J6590_060929 [Homalodisca vitripennis]
MNTEDTFPCYVLLGNEYSTLVLPCCGCKMYCIGSRESLTFVLNKQKFLRQRQLPCEGQPPSHQLPGYPAAVCTQYRETRLLSNDSYPVRGSHPLTNYQATQQLYALSIQRLLPCEGQPPSHQLPGYPAAVCTQYRETRLLSNNCYPVRGSHPLTNYRLPSSSSPHQLTGYPAAVCTQYRETRLLSNDCYPVSAASPHQLTGYPTVCTQYRETRLATTATL